MNPLRKPAPVIMPKGQRYPGSGRVKGTPNRAAVDAHALVSELVNDEAYQRRLRRDFRLRKLHPTIESLVWAYHIGKPRQDLHVTGTFDVTARIAEERRIFAQLDLPELAALAAEAQATLEKAIAFTKGRLGPADLQDVVVEAETGEEPTEIQGFSAGSDNLSYDNHQNPSDQNPTTPTEPEG